jgi:hypothetical protein
MLNKDNNENAPCQEISCINNSLQRYNENEDCEEAIVERTAGKHQDNRGSRN